MKEQLPPSKEQIDEVMRLLEEQKTTVETIEPCSLAFYRKVVRKLSRPTSVQIENFVQYVSKAHSWYKHLPLLPPGVPFVFYLDPFSGFDRIIQAGGHVTCRRRTKKSFAFHYAWRTTRVYRTQFGYLAYYTGSGTKAFVGSDEGVYGVDNPPAFTTRHKIYALPSEIEQLASVELTAPVHPYAPEFRPVSDYLRSLIIGTSDRPARHWPQETGGDAVIYKFIELNERIHEIYLSEPKTNPERWREQADTLIAREAPIKAECDALFLPERQRLQRNMTDAINRMLDLVWEA
jgi:hypothetical protein